jgi:FtsH-binding integral membrane protein
MVKLPMYETPHLPFRRMYDADAHRAHRAKVYLWASFLMHLTMILCAIFPHPLLYIATAGKPSLLFFLVGYPFAFWVYVTGLCVRDSKPNDLLDFVSFLSGILTLFEVPWGLFLLISGIPLD